MLKMKTVKNRLIINADDLGMSENVNNEIEKCIKLGVITSSTLMANAPAFEGGVRIAEAYSHISIGVHLNIVEFAPLTNQEVFRKHGMLSNDGNFIDGAAFVVAIDDELKKAIYEEWDAQITKIEKAGICPTHCDSHQHTHSILELQDVLCRVLDKHNIMKVRRKSIPSIRLMLCAKKNHSTVHLDKSKAMLPKKRNVIYRRINLFVVKYTSWLWNKKMSKKYIMTDGFFSFKDFYSNRDVLGLDTKPSVELMCHPGNCPFNAETSYLMNVKNWMNSDLQLISYNKL